jgi:hypothetical protein
MSFPIFYISLKAMQWALHKPQFKVGDVIMQKERPLGEFEEAAPIEKRVFRSMKTVLKVGETNYLVKEIEVDIFPEGCTYFWGKPKPMINADFYYNDTNYRLATAKEIEVANKLLECSKTNN